VQRRHQKLIEESPAPGLSDEQRSGLCEAAASLARSVSYDSLGTLEFLVDREGRHFFLEMNTRLQVEHGVTELVTGVDLVKLQIRLAQGERLADQRFPAASRGHAIEARLYAEDPDRGFLPSVGPVRVEQSPEGPGIRVDRGINDEDVVSEHYDSLLMKVLAHGRDRAEALARLDQALATTVISGVAENGAFLRAILEDGGFKAGGVATTFLDSFDYTPDLLHPPPYATAAAAVVLARNGSGWRPGGARLQLASGDFHVAAELVGRAVRAGADSFEAEFDGDRVTLSGAEAASRTVEVTSQGETLLACEGGRVWPFRLRRLPSPEQFAASASIGGRSGTIVSPLPGLIREVRVQEGDTVAQGQVVAVLEAMKMEHLIEARSPGVVARVLVSAREQVQADQPLIELGEAPNPVRPE
jgi:acetyl/propionyl-CoA carboxylase alpha subunit